MNTSERGIDLIKRFEGCRLRAYRVSSSELYLTIGYGHYGPDVTIDMVITHEKALDMLRNDVRNAEVKVNKYQTVYGFNQNQFDALVSFAFNVGNIDGLTRNGTRTINEIIHAMPLYVKCKGQTLAGLVTRRNDELALFTEPCVINDTNALYGAFVQTRSEIANTLDAASMYLRCDDTSTADMYALPRTLRRCADLLSDANVQYYETDRLK